LPATKLISTSDASTGVTQISAHAEDESVKTADPQTDPLTTSGTESLPPKPERAIRLFTTPWALVVSLLLGLPAAIVLAWLGMKEDGARGKQTTRKRLDLAASRSQPDVLNHHREPDWIDKLFNDQVQSSKTSLRHSPNAFVETVPLDREAIEAVVRRFAVRHRVTPRYIGKGRPLAVNKAEHEWPKLVPREESRSQRGIRGGHTALRGALRNHS